jgi:hypothetical protein
MYHGALIEYNCRSDVVSSAKKAGDKLDLVYYIYNSCQAHKNVPVIARLVVLLFALLLAASEELKPGPRDKSQACGMFVANYPDWMSAILFRDRRGVAEMMRGLKGAPKRPLYGLIVAVTSCTASDSPG